MRKITWTLLLICMSVSILKSYAQDEINLDVPRIVPISPTAAAMEKYQNYPVDYCTGIPNITIPLYEIIAGEVSIPITLSYHASGIKPKERSGLAGTGWILNLEPSISRQINGVSDSDEYGWFNRTYLQNQVPSDEKQKLIYYGEIVDNKRDTYPDKITYKLPGRGGSGYFYNSFDPLITIPRNNDNVRYRGMNMEITDEKGILYLFNGIHERTSDVITRWMCSSIKSSRNPAQTLVSFQYQIFPYQINPNSFYNLDDKLIFNDNDQITPGSPRIIVTEQRTNANRYYHLTAPLVPGVITSLPDAVVTNVSENNVRTKFPMNSRFVSGYMDFSRIQGADFLGNHLSVNYKSVGVVPHNGDVIDEIVITDENGTIIRSIKFYITPFNSRTSLTKLDSLKISAPGVEPQIYSFRYYSDLSVPSIYTTVVDHWGFCNGAEGSSQGQSNVPSFKKKLLIPDSNGYFTRDSVVFNYLGANREPNYQWTKVGVLEQIINPQGIRTSFYYEGNYGAFRDNKKSSNKRDYLHPVGGLRVERIVTENMRTMEKITKQYDYGLTKLGNTYFEPIWGGGAIKHIVTENDYCSNLTLFKENVHGFEGLTTYNSMPISNITFNNGSAVMYNIVSERIYGNTGSEQKTNYYYSVNSHNFEDILRWDDGDILGSIKKFILDQPVSIIRKVAKVLPAHPREPSDDFLRYYAKTNQHSGALLRTESFKDNVIVASTDYSYMDQIVWSSNLSIDIPVRLLNVDIDYYLMHRNHFNGWSMFAIGDYYSQAGEGIQTIYYLDSKICRVLDAEITKLYFDIFGRKEVVTTEKRYEYKPSDYTPNISLKPARIEIINSDSSKIIDNYDYLVNYPGILSYHKHTENNEWKESRILFKSGTCLPAVVQFRTKQSSEYSNEIVYKSYDSNNNVAEVIGKDGTSVFFIWGYNNQYPIAKIENATRQQVTVALGYQESEFEIFGTWASNAKPSTDVWVKLNYLRKLLPDARVTTYEYIPLQGVVSITDPNSFTFNYDYDGYNRLINSSYLDENGQKNILEQYIYNFIRQ